MGQCHPVKEDLHRRESRGGRGGVFIKRTIIYKQRHESGVLCMREDVCIGLCMCVCVCARECVREDVCMYVCICVCERESVCALWCTVVCCV